METLSSVLLARSICSIDNCNEQCPYYKHNRTLCKKWLERDTVYWLEEYLKVAPMEKLDKWIYWRNKYGKETDD